MTLAGIPEHGHCEICQTPVRVGERFCDKKECLEKHLQNQKEKKAQVYRMIVIIAGAVLLSYLLRF